MNDNVFIAIWQMIYNGVVRTCFIEDVKRKTNRNIDENDVVLIVVRILLVTLLHFVTVVVSVNTTTFLLQEKVSVENNKIFLVNRVVEQILNLKEVFNHTAILVC